LLKINRIAYNLKSADGAEIAEAAVVLPLVFMLLLGIVWFGRAFNIYSTIQQAAQQGAITAARATCATCGSGGSNFPGAGVVDNAIFAVMQASSLDPSQIQAPPGAPTCGTQPCGACPPPYPPAPSSGACSPTAKIFLCQNVQLNPAGQPPQCGSVVSFQYPFQFYLPFTSLNLSQIILSAQAQSRMEN
jgi:hypothetical protein